MNKRKLFIILSVASVIVSCGDSGEKRPQKAAITVDVINVQPVEQLAEHQFSGKVIADDKLTLSTKIIGQVEQILVKEGDKVHKGQLLVKIKDSGLEAKKSTAEASVRSAKLHMENTIKNYNRINTLVEKGSATQKELEDIDAAKEEAIARYNEALYNLEEINDFISYANLTSPLNGFVSKKMVNVGDMAKPGFPLLALESVDELKIEIDVPEFEISKFELNDHVTITVDAVDLANIDGVVERIIPSSSFSGQYKVIVAFNKSFSSLKSGMFAKVYLMKDIESILLISKKSVIKKGQLTGVYTVNQQNEAMLRWVRIGKEYGDSVEILSGLTQGEQLIVSSESKLADGINIKIATTK
jgi:RND family efflux transporter MFP subunit